MSSTFSASPHALGYLYQIRAALFLLLECPDEARVRVEALDDIELENPADLKKLALTQLKHHTGDAGSLGDKSVDLWKTIRVWAEQASEKKFAFTDTRLYLITTASVPSDSAASKLKIEGRSPAEAEKLLSLAAKDSANKSLKLAFQAYEKLTDAERLALVSSITILDENADIDGMRNKIAQRLRPAVKKQFLTSLVERVEGWWVDRAIRSMLYPDAIPYISAFELMEKVAEIAQTLGDDSLPIDFLDEDPDEAFVETSKSKMFVRQLDALESKPRTVRKAILDYYKAFQQRSRWLSEGLIYPDELQRFESLLIDEWERYFDAVCATVGTSTPPEKLLECGRDVLQWAELSSSHLRIRPRVDAEFVRRGSFHMLADGNPIPSVHWHPKFIELLEASINKAVHS